MEDFTEAVLAFVERVPAGRVVTYGLIADHLGHTAGFSGGARQVGRGWGSEQGLSLQTPVIVKYRDERTDLATALEGWLR